MQKTTAKCIKLICKEQCEMREIYMQKTVQNAVNLCAKKQCKMHEIYMRKTVRNAVNLHAKNSAKCGKFMCKKQCEMRHFSANFPYIFCIWIWRIFQCFLQGNLQKIVWQFFICFKLFRDDFYGTLCRDGQGGLIPVKSRSKCGNPDRDCTENTRFCSAMSTKSEIVKPLSQKNGWPLVLTATHQFNAENEVFQTVRAKKEKSWSYGHGVVWNLAKIARVKFCVFPGAKTFLWFLKRWGYFKFFQNWYRKYLRGYQAWSTT